MFNVICMYVCFTKRIYLQICIYAECFKCIEQSNNALNTKDITYTPTTVPIYM